jgi:NAD(P)H-dependent FMN reductase
MGITVSIIYGSVRSERKGIMAAKFLEKKLFERDIKIHFLDPLEYKLPLLDKMYKEYARGTAPEPMETIAAMLNDSDGFLIVTGEYNHSIPPALKNMMDHFQKEYLFKPSAIASYSAGSFGGVRAAVHLRSVVAELGMPAISSELPFPVIGNVFDKDLKPLNERINKSCSRFLDEFVWYINAFKRQRIEGLPY